MSHILSNWEQVHADIEVAADGSRVLWPKELRGMRGQPGEFGPGMRGWGYQRGIVLQNPLKLHSRTGYEKAIHAAIVSQQRKDFGGAGRRHGRGPRGGKRQAERLDRGSVMA